MTTPHGYADYQNYPLWRGAALAATTANVVAGTPLIYTGYVAQFAALQVFIQPQPLNLGIGVSFTWFTDSTMATVQGSYSASVYSQSTLSAVIPNLGNYVQVIISTTSGTPIATQISIQPVNTPVSKPAYNAIGSYVASHQQSLLPGSSFLRNFPYVVEGNGLAVVKTNTPAVNYDVIAQQVSSSGLIVADLFEILGTTTPTFQTFQSGSGTVQFTVVNHDPGTQIFDIRCGILSQ